MTSVLISGAGIAGSTLAFWLARHGLRPTVIERAGTLRSSGNPVDVRGPALPVAEAMGVLPALRAAATSVRTLRLLDRDDRSIGTLPTRRARSDEVEVPRGDLASALFAAARDDVEIVFDDSIAGLTQDRAGVDVTFERGAPRRFDYVVGADGLHSVTRRLIFGPSAPFARHLGVYIATVPLGRALDDPAEVWMWNTPGRSLSLHPGRGAAGAALMFRSRPIAGFDHRDVAQHRRLVTVAVRGAAGPVPEFLDRVRESPDLYFDSVSQIRLPHWSRGRVGLLGDAASCVSLFGEGSSLAIAGAFDLAESLAAGSFDRYEAVHRPRVAAKQRLGRLVAGLIVPRTRTGLAVRNLGVRVA
jgi:2-polyprenyl-6-methoxyphenol hydroxylase-like FAD-dependent oxidoreductase